MKLLIRSLIFIVSFMFITSTAAVNNSSGWVNISYKELLDKKTIIRTGQTLESALSNPELKGAMQPFLDSYSYLLPYALDMLDGPEDINYQNLISDYPVGFSQPVWVAILRSGHILLQTDYKGHVRIFLPGLDAQKTYNDFYSLLRHPLKNIAQYRKPLDIKVYVYQNIYSQTQLQINKTAYSFRQSYFPPEKNKILLNMANLERFFRTGATLEGARLDHQKGLILFGKLSEPTTFAGNPETIADFAAAYRAVFWAGDNKAFISLDPHPDVSKAAVNFGGYLEDTHIGDVVLEADKRFKTITSGLDPNSAMDVRAYTRKFVPDFFTVSERDILSNQYTKNRGWIKTRFWFYPDNITIEADPQNTFARIINPQFTADAERSRDDFATLQEFERKKKQYLLPAIRSNIDHLNEHYQDYAKAYPELKELSQVGRLIGLCSWLKKVNPVWLDLDELLAVELPPFKTSREKTQLMAISFLREAVADNVQEATVKKNLRIIYVSSVLEQTIGEYFKNSVNYKDFISQSDSHTNSKDIDTQFRQKSPLRIKELVRTKADLENLLAYESKKYKPDLDEYMASQQKKIEQDKKQLQLIVEELNNKRNMVNTNEQIVSYNNLVNSYNKKQEEFNREVGEFNIQARSLKFPFIMEIGGGINLEPENFNIITVKQSPGLTELEQADKNIQSGWLNSESPQSKPTEKPFLSKSAIAKKQTNNKKTATIKASNPVLKKVETKPQMQINRNEKTWEVTILSGKNKISEKKYDIKNKELRIVNYGQNQQKANLKGTINDRGEIVFSYIR
ncbi:MAG: hypothetical protein PHV30_11600 [Candidatus Margulisbacteria bacterium]|nr:hypothetical protein [Candidatus Margulisiibacteriota bacterium]